MLNFHKNDYNLIIVNIIDIYYNLLMQNNSKRGLLIIISGPSGVGKGTVRKEFMSDPSLNLFYSVSITTRAMRPGEQDGVDYYYVSKEEFQRNIDINNFLEWAEFVGNRYGTPKDKVNMKRDEGKNVVLEIEVNGTDQVLKNLEGDDIVSIFIVPPSLEELEHRLRNRGTETDEVIKRRIATASKELKLQDHYQYVVVNDEVSRAAEEIKNIIRSRMNSAK